MSRTRSVVAGVAVLLAACVDDVPLQPRGPEAVGAPAVAPVGPATAAVALAACTHHWTNASGGAWFTAGNWNPATVPGAGSTACIDAAGTYTVSLDPNPDATPVDLDGLSIGGWATGVQTLLVKGVGAIVNIATGVDVKTSGVFSLEGFNAVVVTAGAISNAGTVQTLNVCGGCGNATIRSDLDNAGTLRAANNGLILGKANAVYRNTGTIDVVGTLTIPASAGSPSFTLESGSITSTAGNPNNADFRMLAGTFTYTGGDALSTARGLVTLEGANLVFGPSPAGTAAFSMLPSAAGNTFTGNIGATQTVRMPLVGGPLTMASRTLTLVGDVVNNGTLELQQSPATGFPILAGTGTLLNKGTLLSTGSGNDSVRIAINLRNEGTITSNGRYLQFDQPSLAYVNAGTIGGTGTLRVNGATLINEATAQLTITTELRNVAHLKGSGANTTFLRAFSGSTVDPGFSPGTLTLGALQDINGGILNIELGGETEGSGYDQFQVAGQATLSLGTLNVTALNGFLAGKCGQVFNIIVHNSPGGIGTFANITGLDQGGGRLLKIVYGKPAIKLVGLDGGKLVGLQPDAPSLTEGGPSALYYACLGAQPNANVTITPSPDAQVSVSPASITFTPSDWELPKAFTIQAVDDQGAEGDHTGTVNHAVTSTDSRFSGFALSPMVANITDNDVNNPPVAGTDAAQTAEDTPVTIDVLVNDSDPDGDTYSVTAAGGASHGAVQVVNGGTAVRYTPSANYNGPDAFSYTLADNRGKTTPGTVNVTVTPVADPPAATDDGANTTPGSPVVVNVLANDSDPDGDALTVSAVTQPGTGSASISGGGQSVTYTPPAGFLGSTSFTYTGSDGNGGTATATVTVTVATNRAPSAVRDAARTSSASAVAIPVLANDSDPDGDPLQVTAVTQPANGTATITDGGQTVTYSPPAGFVGIATFRYTAEDGRGGRDNAVVVVTVRRPAPPPPPPPQAPPRSDLAITVTQGPNPARVGQRVDYVVTVRNNGPATSNPTTTRIRWSDPTFRVVSVPPGCTALGAPAPGAECVVPSLPPGGTIVFRHAATWYRRQSLTVVSEVTPNPLTSDPNFRNNVVVLTTTWQ